VVEEALPWVHRLDANFKRWAYGTCHGVRDEPIDIYANEFVFRLIESAIPAPI
jgi:hypothetical protein